MSTANIPLIYRLIFTYLDPILAGGGGLLQFLSPLTSLTSFVANPPTPIPWQMEPIFEQNGAGALCVGFLTAVLTRVSSDLKVWKTLQAGVLIMDLATIYTIWKTLGQQGRLGVGEWRAEEWQWVVPIAVLTVARSAFILGVGLGGKGGGGKAKRG